MKHEMLYNFVSVLVPFIPHPYLSLTPKPWTMPSVTPQAGPSALVAKNVVLFQIDSLEMEGPPVGTAVLFREWEVVK